MKMTRIQKFVEDNNIEMDGIGSEANSNYCILAGYICYIDASLEEITEYTKTLTRTIELDFDKVLTNAKKRNYGLWWEKASNRRKFKL